MLIKTIILINNIMLDRTLPVILQAHKENKILKIDGYVDSKGVRTHLKVRFLPPGGYRAIILECLEWIQSAAVDEIFPQGMDPVAWSEALKSKELSYKNFLDPDTPAARSRPRKSESMTSVGDSVFFGKTEGEGDAIYLYDLERTPECMPTLDLERNFRNDKTKSGFIIEHYSPRARYVGTLLLAEGKFTSIQAVDE